MTLEVSLSILELTPFFSVHISDRLLTVCFRLEARNTGKVERRTLADKIVHDYESHGW